MTGKEINQKLNADNFGIDGAEVPAICPVLTAGLLGNPATVGVDHVECLRESCAFYTWDDVEERGCGVRKIGESAELFAEYMEAMERSLEYIKRDRM